jgi:hypothetical protein
MKLGRKPFVHDSRDLEFARYRTNVSLPVVPTLYGYDNIYARDGWGMLGNDQYGDCVWAGAAHETMLQNHVAGHPVNFTTAGVLGDYAACTGFNPDDPNSDQGTDVRMALGYRRSTGILDMTGKRHTIGAYLALDVSRIARGDFSEIAEAVYLFGQVGLGIQCPESAQDQFSAGEMWSYVKGSPIDGGHYVPVVAHRKHVEIVTWGRVVPCGVRFLENYIEEAWAILSPDFLTASGRTVAGFDYAALNADLAAL